MAKKKRARKNCKLPGIRAWAWECNFGLCKWAEPKRDHLLNEPEKPSPEAKPVLVRIVRESELRKLLATRTL